METFQNRRKYVRDLFDLLKNNSEHGEL